MAKIDLKYHELVHIILADGKIRPDPNRKGVNRLQIPSYTFKHDFKDGFPAITTKKLYWKGVVGELLWFLRGDTHIKYLQDNNINIWNKDAANHDEGGQLGRIYGAQWRKFGKPSYDTRNGYSEHVDQIRDLINNLKTNPLSSQHIVTAWNPTELDSMALPPCHWSFEILVEPHYKNKRVNEASNSKQHLPEYQFTLKWHQRSVDTFLGLPFNIASYALLAQIIGKLTNMIPVGIIGDLSNVHIYEPHLDSVKEQLSRSVLTYGKPLELEPFGGFKMDQNGRIDSWLNSKEIKDFRIKDYESYPAIKAEMLAYSN